MVCEFVALIGVAFCHFAASYVLSTVKYPNLNHAPNSRDDDYTFS